MSETFTFLNNNIFSLESHKNDDKLPKNASRLVYYIKSSDKSELKESDFKDIYLVKLNNKNRIEFYDIYYKHKLNTNIKFNLDEFAYQFETFTNQEKQFDKIGNEIVPKNHKEALKIVTEELKYDYYFIIRSNKIESFVKISIHGGKYISVKMLFTSEEYRGKGNASKLLDLAKFLCVKYGGKFVELYAYNENKNAIRLYEKNGFKRI